jgi:hypothetical protein
MTPAAEANATSSALSAINCRKRRPLPAPIDERMRISVLRAEARDNCIVATFAHAISSSNPTMAIKSDSGCANRCRTGDRPDSAERTASCGEGRLGFKNSRACQSAVIHWPATASVTCACSRPTTCTLNISFDPGTTVTKKSGARPMARPKKLAGVTPITVNVWPSISIALPSTVGSAPNSRRQNLSLRTTARSVACPSRGSNSRPRAGRMPSMVK